MYSKRIQTRGGDYEVQGDLITGTTNSPEKSRNCTSTVPSYQCGIVIHANFHGFVGGTFQQCNFSVPWTPQQSNAPTLLVMHIDFERHYVERRAKRVDVKSDVIDPTQPVVIVRHESDLQNSKAIKYRHQVRDMGWQHISKYEEPKSLNPD